MSMTPEELYQLSSFGQIPAETDISALVERFWDGSAGVFTPQRTLEQNMLVCTSKTTDVSTKATAFDITSNINPFILDAYTQFGILLIVHIMGSTNASITCKFRNGDSASETTKTAKTSYFRPGVFGWVASASNLDSAKFSLYTSSGTFRAKWAILGFPLRSVT